MKIGVLSDTHDQYENIRKVIRILNKENVTFTVHCGDWVSPFTQEFYRGLHGPLWGIFGNNDGDTYYHLVYAKNTHVKFKGRTYRFTVGGRKIFMYHGENEEITNALLMCGEFDAVFHGHTHRPVNKKIGKTLSLNPGTLMPITDDNIKGASLAIYNTKDNTAKIIKL